MQGLSNKKQLSYSSERVYSARPSYLAGLLGQHFFVEKDDDDKERDSQKDEEEPGCAKEEKVGASTLSS